MPCSKRRERLSADSVDSDSPVPDGSKAPESATFEGHLQAVIAAATKNLELQKAVNDEAKQALADAKQKLDTSKENEKDAASKKYEEALAASGYADSSVKLAERVRLEAIGDKRGLALAAEDKVVAALAKVRRAEDHIDNLDKPFSDLDKATADNLKAWSAAVVDAEKRGDESEIRACKAGENRAVARVRQAEERRALDL